MIILCQYSIFGQITINKHFNWSDNVSEIAVGDEILQLWKFDDAIISGEIKGLPVFSKQFDIPSYGSLQVEVISASFESFPMRPSTADEYLTERLSFKTAIGRDRNKYYGQLDFTPIIKVNGSYERLVDVELRVHFISEIDVNFRRGPETTETSVLKDGSIYKLAINEHGVYKLSYTFLKDKLNIDVDNIDPRTIKVYGNGGGMVPFYSEAERIDDLMENEILVVGEEDGSFDSGDYVLFYAEGADEWTYSASKQTFSREENIYDNQNFYFLKIDSGNGVRVGLQANEANATYTTSTFSDYARFEEEELNVYHEWEKAEGSGQQWFGDYFKVVRTQSYDNIFSFPNLVTEEPVELKAVMALRSDVKSKFNLTINGQTFNSSLASLVSRLSGRNDNIINYYHLATIEESINLNSDNVDISVNYPIPNTSQPSEGWLDFIELNVRRQLIMTGSQMAFRDISSIGQNVATFQLGAVNSTTKVWDITDPLHPSGQEINLNGSLLQFGTVATELKEFIAFDPAQALLEPEFVEKLENQNIHGITEADLVIIYPKDFESQAIRLAEHRRSHNDYNVSLVLIDNIYNEFSSGRQDPSAIRDFARMLYERTANFKYMLLFGDASFDFKNIYNLNQHYITTYEKNSANPLYNFPTDDYMGILYHTSTLTLRGNLNIAIGRFPVNDINKAEEVVDKIISYDSDPATMKDWRTRIVFVADDEDGALHSDSADAIADFIRADFPLYNVDKLYVDAFEQVSTPAGDRSPATTSSFNKSIFKGILAAIYLGHGGPKGWAQERILNISDIVHWNNEENLPLFITATCSFTAFDDPKFVSAGEEVFLNPKGGAITMFTTTRAVFASSNAKLTKATMRHLLTQDTDHVKTMGDVFKAAKNDENSVNAQKYALIGDPSQTIALPQYEVVTTKIDGHEIIPGAPDTIRALQKVIIEGVVLNDDGGVFEQFNGTIYPTIYDKDLTFQTLGQDTGSPVRDYKIQKNVLFKGRATVINGRFSFSCIIPKDINYEFGAGKISYYAADNSQMIDAAGYSKDIVIGGVTTTGFTDDEGPEVEVFINTEDFIFGGIANNEPTLLVKLSDDNGINVVGNSIGHDLEGLVDGNTQNTLILNDFYEAELDDYTKGMVKYPLSKLAEGRHTMRVKAWDVANNSAEGYTEFVVAGSAQVALEHVFNYPNPFFNNTCFQFDHNVPGAEMEVSIRIYTVSGKLIKTIHQVVINDGAIRQDDCIEWDGLDEYGDTIGRGVYIYKVYVNVKNGGSKDIKGESAFEKLVILK